LSNPVFPHSKEWTSGYDLAEGIDLLIHDSQYTDEMYKSRAGFGHSSLKHALQFAQLACVKAFVPFHHDPSHNDAQLDRMIERSVGELLPDFPVRPGMEGMEIEME
jgi:ribonuclease BN (tRNA processing enzyme)